MILIWNFLETLMHWLVEEIFPDKPTPAYNEFRTDPVIRYNEVTV